MNAGRRLQRASRSVIASGVAVATLMAAVACASSGSDKGSTDAGGTLRYGAVQPLVTFDPAQAQAGGDHALYMAMVYDTLVSQDVDGNLVPDLATSWHRDSLTQYTFKLRRGVTYQDGSSFTASTAKASLDRSLAGRGPRASSLAPIAGVQAVDPTTLRITLKTQDPDLLETLASSPGAMLGPAGFSRSDLASHPDGTGPYRYDASQSVQGDHYTFTVNPHWWAKAAIPRASTVVFKVLSDQTARLNALRTHQIDIASITADQASEAQQAGLKIASQPNTWAGMMILDRAGKTVPALGSTLVRRAMALALDRKSLVDALLYGYGVASDQAFAKGTVGYDPDLEAKYAYNRRKAKQLIAQSGFKHISFTAPVAPAQQRVYEAVKSELADVGITMKLQVEQPNSLAPIARTTKYPVLTFPLPNRDPFSRYQALWAPYAGFNPFHVDDPTLDRLAQQFANATTRSQQATIGRKLNDEVINQGIVVVGSHPDDLAAYSPTLKGVHMSLFQVPRIIGIHF